MASSRAQQAQETDRRKREALLHRVQQRVHERVHERVRLAPIYQYMAERGGIARG